MKDLNFYISVDGGASYAETTYSPDGWNEQFINYERSEVFWGMMYDFTIPLTFRLADADLLRSIYYSQGISADCLLKVEKRNKLSNVFELRYTAILDFSKAKDTLDGFEIVAISDNTTKKLMNNDSIKYDIDISTQKQSNVLRFDGISGRFETITQTSSTYNNLTAVAFPVGTLPPVEQYLRIEMDAFKFLDIQGSKISIINRDVDGYNIYCNSACSLKINTVGSSRTYKLENITTVATGTKIVRISEKIIRLRSGVRTTLQTLSYSDHTVTDGMSDIVVSLPYVNVDTEMDLLPNDEVGVFLTAQLINYGTPLPLTGNIAAFDMRYINDVAGITQQIEIDAPLAQAEFGISTLAFIFNQLCLNTCGKSYKSDLLDSLSLFLVTPRTTFSYYVDGVEQTWSTITTSLMDFYDYMNSLLPVGIGVEVINGVEYVRLESLQYWLDNSQPIIEFENVNQVTIETAQNIIPNTIIAGFNDYFYGDKLGLQEFMGQHQFKCPQNVLKNDYRIVSPYRMDNTGFDYIRKLNIDMWFKGAVNGLSVQNVVGEVAEWNDIFVFDCALVETISGVNYYELNRNDISITDVNFIHPETAYNLYWTPYRNFLRHGNYLASVLMFLEGETIDHTTISKYPYVRTLEITEAEIAEGTNPLISAIGTAYFKPFYVTFTAPFTDQQFDAYENNKLSRFRITFNDVVYTGFLMSAQKKLAGLKETEFKLLLSL